MRGREIAKTRPVLVVSPDAMNQRVETGIEHIDNRHTLAALPLSAAGPLPRRSHRSTQCGDT
ncbi:MAG: type II toxin-antitoxin system PemK/MazF family toxin [Rhodoferax sp.]|nr:type II toxin-antitoxin system PemK/MazF family toxin [Rhodoferax sp.]